MVFYAIPGWGKTTYLSQAYEPIILMARGERGYDTLLRAGRVRQVPAELIETWTDMLAWLDALIANPQGRMTVAIDGFGCLERLCHEHVCKRDFKNDWSDSGFASFQKGYDVSLTEWIGMLQRLDTLKDRHGMQTIIAGHSKVTPFKNPMGADYDRYECDVHKKTWAATSRWASDILFAKFETIIDREKKGKGKGIGGTDRIIYGAQRDAYDAKSQHGFPEEYRLTGDINTMYDEIMEQLHNQNKETT